MFEVDVWGDDVAASLDALPPHLLSSYAELHAALEVSPATVGRPLVAGNPDGSRTAVFGLNKEGQIVFMIGRHDDDRRVTIVQVTYL